VEIVPIWKLAVALAAGVAIGLVYFGGLWMTVRRLSDARRPHVWALVSFAARTVVAVATIGLMAWLGGWQTLAACMAGFIAMRLVTARMLANPGGLHGRLYRHAARDGTDVGSRPREARRRRRPRENGAGRGLHPARQ